MRPLLMFLAAACGLGTGCVRDDLVECADGRVCPSGTVCDVARTTCVDLRGLSVPEGDLDFASVGCGAREELVLPIRNFGISPIEFDARSTVGGVTVVPATATVAPGGSLDLVISAEPAANSIPGVTSQGSLVLSTGFELIERTIKLTSVGALAVADQQTLDFGQIPVDGSSTRTLVVHNRGNVATDFTLAQVNAHFTANPMGQVRVEAGGTRMVNLEYASDEVELLTFEAALSFSGTHCQPPPTTVKLFAETSGDPVLTSHTILDFGTTTCSVASQARTVTLTNQTGATQAIAPTLAGIDASSYVGPAANTLPAGAGMMATLQVTRNALGIVPIGVRTSTLTVDLSPASTQKLITLTHAVVAPVLQITPSGVDFGAVPSHSISSRVVRVYNLGNATASITLATKDLMTGGDSTLMASPSTFQIAAGSSADVTFTLIAGSTPLEITKTMGVAAPGACSAVNGISIRGSVNRN